MTFPSASTGSIATLSGSTNPDILVYEEPDERFNVEAYKTRSQSYIFLVSRSHTTSEARFIPATQPDGNWQIIEPRKQGVEYYPDHNGSSFYIRVNDTGRNFRLVSAPVTDPGSKNWHEVLAHNPDIMLDEMDLFRNFLVLYQREDGLPQIRVTDLRDGTIQAHCVSRAGLRLVSLHQSRSTTRPNSATGTSLRSLRLRSSPTTWRRERRPC